MTSPPHLSRCASEPGGWNAATDVPCLALPHSARASLRRAIKSAGCGGIAISAVVEPTRTLAQDGSATVEVFGLARAEAGAGMSIGQVCRPSMLLPVHLKRLFVSAAEQHPCNGVYPWVWVDLDKTTMLVDMRACTSNSIRSSAGGTA
jgi:hypothetical protein